jgi:hypothetical protein
MHELLHAHGVGAAIHCLAADGADELLSGGADGSVRQWVLPPLGEQARSLVAVGRSVDASPTRALLHLQQHGFDVLCASGHQNGTLRLWRGV